MPEDIERLPFFGGWFDSNTNPSQTTEKFDVYDTTLKDYRGKEPPKFYDNLLIEYEENDWFSFLVDYLVGELFTDYEFVGDGADDVRQFFTEVDPLAYDEVEMMGLNVVREGTGALKKYWLDGELKQIKAMNGRLIRLNLLDKKGKVPSKDSASKICKGAGGPNNIMGQKVSSTSPSTAVNEVEDTKWLQVTVSTDSKFAVNLKTWRIDNFEDYRDDQIALCRIKRDPRSPYGIPFGRSCFHIIKAMKMIDRDVLSALKANAANLKVIRADLSGLDSDAAKKTALENLGKAYDKIATATTGVIAIDNHHEVGYMGTMGTGSRDGRLLSVMEHLEPVVSALLMNFLLSIGLIEQTVANKSLIARQEIRAERQISRYQRAVSRFFETQVFPDITEQDCRLVFCKFYEPEIWLKFWEKNIVTRETLMEKLSLVDEGNTYFNDVSMPMGQGGMNFGKGADKKADTSNDDSSDLRTREEEQ